MPEITGDLRRVTKDPSTVTHVWIHAPESRPSGESVILTESQTVAVTSGRFRTNIDIGDAIVVPLSSGLPSEPIAILVTESTRTLAHAMQNAAQLNLAERNTVAEKHAEIVQAMRAAAESATAARNAAAASARDTANAIRSEIGGLSEQARRSSESAGTHETRARGHADRAATAATDAVTRAVNQLKGAAPAAFDTLAEIADRIKAGGSLESELLRKIAEKASNSEFQALVSRVSGLSISSISGLSAALAGKAASSHRHTSAEISDAAYTAVANRVMKRDGSGRAQVKDPTSGEDIANKQYVDGLLGGLRFARGRGSDPNTVYFEV